MNQRRSSPPSWLAKFHTNGRPNIIDYNAAVPRNYAIPNRELESFFRRIGRHVKDDRKHSLAEVIVPNSNVAIIGKISLNYGSEVETPFPYVFIMKCVRAFQDAILKVLEVKEERVIAAVIHASTDFEGSLIIQFPLIAAGTEIQERIVYPVWEQLMRDNNAAAELESQPISMKVETDNFQKHWWLLGATVPLKRYRYKLENYFRYITNKDIEDNEQYPVYFEDIFNPAVDCSYVVRGLFKPNFFLSTKPETNSRINSTVNSASTSSSVGLMNTSDHNLEFDIDIWEVLFLSPYYPIVEASPKEIEVPKENGPFTSYTNGTNVVIDDLFKLCQMLPANVRCRHPYINKIGQACYKIFDGSNRGFELWKYLTTKNELDVDYDDEFSSDRSFGVGEDNFFPLDIDENIEDLDKMFELREDDFPGFHTGLNMSEEGKVWESFRLTDTDNYSIETVKYLASIYATLDYDRWLFQNCEHEFKMASGLLEKPVADLFYAYYPWDFIWTGSGWYYFNNHRWREDSKEGIILAKRLSDNKRGFVTRIRQHKFIFERTMENESDPFVRAQIQSFCERIEGIFKKLATTTFISKVITMLKMMYYRPDFEKIKDENPYVLVFENGVHEFTEDMAISRPGLPEDLCSLSTNINYRSRVPPEHEKFIRIYFNQVYPNRELRNWMWLYFVSGLVGGNPDKIITMHQGSGNNSKTQIIKLLEKSFGDYFIVGNNIEILANARQNRSVAEPEKIRRKGRRWNAYNELSPYQPIDVGTFKNLSGDDSQGGARDLFGGSKTMYNVRLQAKTMLVFNEDPPFSSGANDDALWDRVAKISYLSKWVKTAPSDFVQQWETNRFQLDSHFSKYLAQYAESFISLLIRSWKKYKNMKLPACKIIVDETKKYRRKADICQLYVDERIKIINTPDNLPDKRYKKSTAQLYADYQAWYARTYPVGSSSSGGAPRNGILSRPSFEAEMARKDLQFEGTNYIGVVIKTQQATKNNKDEDDSGSDEEDDEYEKID